MKNLIKISRKMMILAVLSIGLFFLTYTDTGTTKVAAAPCCSDCEAQEQECYALPPGPEHDACLQSAFRCYRWCSFGC